MKILGGLIVGLVLAFAGAVLGHLFSYTDVERYKVEWECEAGGTYHMECKHNCTRDLISRGDQASGSFVIDALHARAKGMEIDGSAVGADCRVRQYYQAKGSLKYEWGEPVVPWQPANKGQRHPFVLDFTTRSNCTCPP